jgi:hypothetical protein
VVAVFIRWTLQRPLLWPLLLLLLVLWPLHLK